MRVMVTFEHRFISTPDGHVYSRGTVDYGFLSRYLAVFDEVVVLARVENADEIPPNKKRADGPNVSFFPVPYYFGPIQFLKRHREVKAIIEQAVNAADAYILRVTGLVGTLLWRHLMKKGIPYGVEVVGDPWDVFSPGSVKTKLRPFLRRKMTWDLGRQCRAASAASYVTEYSLQKRYPSQCWSTHYSTIDLPADVILDDSTVDKRTERIESKINSGEPLRLCFVGQMSQMYKAQDILISSVADCTKKGINLELVMLGDGQYRQQLEEQAQRLGITEKVHFLGNVPAGKAVYEELDKSEVFVLPSRQEGLPRALIEAMARGLPCIASNVGGIPELLDDEYMVPPGKVEPLAKKIEEVLADTIKLREMSQRNLQKAHEYCIDELSKRRNEFYQKLADITERWRSANQAQ
jgi:glycosyltransferase involved in cell wall biosynthesis